MADNSTYLFDPTPYSGAAAIRRPYRDPAVAAAIRRLGATLAQLTPEERERREARARALGVRDRRR